MAFSKESQQYWDTYVNDIEVAQHEVGTPEFFEDLRVFRYDPDRMGYMLDEIRRLGAAHPQGRVLEVGCGPGTDLRQLAAAGLHPVAIDMTLNGARLAKQHLRTFGLPGQVIVCDAEKLCFRPESFDAVWSAGVLHHVDDTEAAISEIHRVLKRGGTFVAVLYHKYSWLYFLSKLFHVKIEHTDAEAPIIKTYSKKKGAALLSQFRNVEVYLERPPRPTKSTRKGVKAFLFNRVLCPVFKVLPQGWGKAIGWHLVLRGSK
ncbi:MAG: class I SAM-dependent methyltransferase [candidate division KSB1 bacterium]|nr:class I SAM-dependent methyltransferase [candidate division KSB1 bacterium]